MKITVSELYCYYPVVFIESFFKGKIRNDRIVKLQRKNNYGKSIVYLSWIKRQNFKTIKL